AILGEGSDLRNTDRAKQISDRVINFLQDRAKNDPALGFVKFKQIGLVRSDQEALEDAQRLHADLVIWGQVQINGSDATLQFQVLETPDRVSNPSFPRVMSLIDAPASATIALPDSTSQTIAVQAANLASLTFGLAHFYRWDFPNAARAFQTVTES